ncbi:alpha/beta hydrolase [Microthyrium microscopicum]|uniref:Alpha/beta hydrolase n=1 Tax=Microthyrium microscopicum TaxID=703497 RepID=A0A6A6U9K0_9PEZI|nr:alpha/beta hydrolase [Microthyrium microscopicum]
MYLIQTSAVVTLLISLFFTLCSAQAIPLYSNDIPNSIPGTDQETATKDPNGIKLSKVRNPTLTPYLPKSDKPTSAVIICPGGGYTILAWDHEGVNPAQQFQAGGVAAFILKYRLPSDVTMKDKSIGPVQDAQQAIKLVRSRAKEFNVDPHRIGLMGFSAGGHLASTAGTHFNKSYINNSEGTSLRPDFLALIYPVISFTNPRLTHVGSRDFLLGANATDEQKYEFSNELHITQETPRTFLAHAADDSTVPVGNSIKWFNKLMKYKTPASMHIYERGGHGFGMKNPTSKDDWFAMLLNWMEAAKLRTCNLSFPFNQG